MSTSGEIFAQHPSVLNRYFKGSAAREAEKATELPPVGKRPPLSIFVVVVVVVVVVVFSLVRDNSCFFACQTQFFENVLVFCFFLKFFDHACKQPVFFLHP